MAETFSSGTLHILITFQIYKSVLNVFISIICYTVEYIVCEKSFVLINVVHVLALSCNRWRIVARPGLKPRVFRWLCEHNHLATKPPGHLTNNFSPEPYPGYTLPGHFKFVHIFPVGKSTNSLYPSTKDIQTKPSLHRFFLCWEPFVTGENCGSNPGPFADRANTLPLSYRATRSSHQQLFTWILPWLQSDSMKNITHVYKLVFVHS